jgi:hypothetical protein
LVRSSIAKLTCLSQTTLVEVRSWERPDIKVSASYTSCNSVLQEDHIFQVGIHPVVTAAALAVKAGAYAWSTLAGREAAGGGAGHGGHGGQER